MAIRIITDSTSDIPLDEAQNLGIEIAPLKVRFGSEEYVDKYTITNEQFYQKLSASDALPTTALVNPKYFIEMFSRFPEDNIVGIFISHKLSGTFQSAMIAKDTLERQNIYLVDSTSTTGGLALLVMEAHRMRAAGHEAAEIYDALAALAGSVRVYAVIDTLKYLVMGGRLNAVSGAIGEALNLKPIVRLVDGVISSITKVRGARAAQAKLVDLAGQQCEIDFDRGLQFIHACDDKRLEVFVRLFQEKYPMSRCTFSSVGSVVGTHTGPGLLGVCFFDKKRD
jgi:DegV family protein with EDD domain